LSVGEAVAAEGAALVRSPAVRVIAAAHAILFILFSCLFAVLPVAKNGYCEKGNSLVPAATRTAAGQ
jgi:hypothetical protein